MKTRIAILVACAGTLALAQTDVARADFAGATALKTSNSVAAIRSQPAIVVAFKITENESPRPTNRVKLGNKNGGSKNKAGLVARYSGPGNGNMYLGQTKREGTGGNGALRFETVGSSLKKR